MIQIRKRSNCSHSEVIVMQSIKVLLIIIVLLSVDFFIFFKDQTVLDK